MAETKTPASETCSYEKSREQRIKENRERMQKLGILDLSSNLKSLCSSKRKIQKPKFSSDRKPDPLTQPGPVRRSSRLQNVTPISYSEVRKDVGLSEKEVILREEGSKPEIYTEEHEKLLGSTERSWTLFVDGYGKDGKRVYDPVKGKTCHQCRQKTLGYRTHCTMCNMVQGQFCGDCLYMRYGEHVLETMENPDWKCPVCRGICNCSLCRQSKGWPPTGSLYRKISKLGYKSVAHYLILSRRALKNTEGNLDSTTQISAKRALAFSVTELSTEFAATGKNDSETLNLGSENQVCGICNNDMEGKSLLVKRSLMLSDAEASNENVKSAAIDSEVNKHLGLLKQQPEDPKEAGSKSGDQDALSTCRDEGEKEKSFVQIGTTDNTALKQEVDKEKNGKGIADDKALQGSPNLKKKRAFAVEPSPDSIAGRLRQRRRTAIA